jgi:prevent-host-death family protein
MAESLTLTEARQRLAAVIGNVLARGERYLITRRGQPVAALVSVEDLRGLEAIDRSPERSGGALALVGLWADVPDAEIDALVGHLRAERDEDGGRAVDVDPRSTEPRG